MSHSEQLKRDFYRHLKHLKNKYRKSGLSSLDQLSGGSLRGGQKAEEGSPWLEGMMDDPLNGIGGHDQPQEEMEAGMSGSDVLPKPTGEEAIMGMSEDPNELRGWENQEKPDEEQNTQFEAQGYGGGRLNDPTGWHKESTDELLLTQHRGEPGEVHMAPGEEESPWGNPDVEDDPLEHQWKQRKALEDAAYSKLLELAAVKDFKTQSNQPFEQRLEDELVDAQKAYDDLANNNSEWLSQTLDDNEGMCDEGSPLADTSICNEANRRGLGGVGEKKIGAGEWPCTCPISPKWDSPECQQMFARGVIPLSERGKCN
jgi:hypothetical protein